MSRSDPNRLADMLMAADEIAAIVVRGKANFDADSTLRRALERCLEIFGEAAKAVSPEVRNRNPDVPWSDLAKVRDRLSHHYHRVDPTQLWVIAVKDVPRTAEMIRRINPD